MGWLKDKLSAEPVECPRGWGQITFTPNVLILPMMFQVDHTCPIGGVGQCGDCQQPLEPGATELLRQRLEDLELLRGSALSEAEFRVRRRLIVGGLDSNRGDPGEKAATAALITGPIGVVTTGLGWYLATAVHPGFMAILAGGLVVSAVAVGLRGVSRMKRAALPSPNHPLLDEIDADATLELEARLGQAREELGFYRELHGADVLGPPAATTDDPDQT